MNCPQEPVQRVEGPEATQTPETCYNASDRMRAALRYLYGYPKTENDQ